MILAALILQAAAPQSAVDAERAFNAAAQAKGQWTAFRDYAAVDAVMFVPQPTNAQAWMKDRKDPPKSVEWWPTESYVSCDGKLAVNTGGWKRPNGEVGFFSTVWQLQADGSWKWIVDGGDALTAARQQPAEPKVVRAACGRDDRLRAYVGEPVMDPEEKSGLGGAPDKSILWEWHVGADGRRSFKASVWTSAGYEAVINDQIAAPVQ